MLGSFVEAINRNIIDGVIWVLAQTSQDSYSSISYYGSTHESLYTDTPCDKLKTADRMIDSKRKYRAADLIEYILYDSSLNEGVNEEFLKE
ncbi:hypothetical protein RhiirA5_422491 [Rhizophagus irregularis]|uniref:Uncharacterized protein n=1 Tax=Rhizophagus irregularis TaxID=588596 RepID=A0A2I1EUP4_9GLOM|nr:hypothetical protein RhiirA5_422491 [Rhizophagus irregularis]PKC66420.1 hypothetical protein RhiirA1_459741 [Rhizophagus irregularis]PKY25829.1 hypothetical protein RhiirB3_440931 [Rhizophagus irregularis]